MKIGIIREGKVPIDKRVALTPLQCEEVIKKFPNSQILVQKSPLRCYKDQEYASLGFELREDVSDCDILLGIKEVPQNELIPQKTYFFFSHTIKKQPYNRVLLIAVLNKQLNLIDYETLTAPDGQRIIAFGRYAGLVGAYNGIRCFGLKYNFFNLKPAHQCFDLEDVKSELQKVTLPSIKIVITGGGRVARGAMEILDFLGIQKVDTADFLQKTYENPVYTQLNPNGYNEKKDGGPFDINGFMANPGEYRSSFGRFLPVTDLLIAAAYWDPKAPKLFEQQQIAAPDFKIKVIADITCDIDGSIPTTQRASSIDEPFYDYVPGRHMLVAPFSDLRNITVMAVDNLPNELPRDASESFGRQLIDNVLDKLLIEDTDGTIERAMIAKGGKLTRRFKYLQDFVDGKR